MINFTKVIKSFQGLFRPVINDVSLSLEHGDFCVLIGANGCGKSTLFKLISGEYKADAGEIKLNGDVAQVVQDVNLGTVPEMTLLENIALSEVKTPKMLFYRRYKYQVLKRLKELDIVAGGLLAVGTSQVALRLKVNSLLAGIILSTMAYSINLRIMGKPNIALFDMGGINIDIISLIIVVMLCIIPFALFLHTDFGLGFRTIGSNPKFAIHKGISVNKYTSLGLFIAGSMFGLAGSLIVQMQQFMDVGMGVGIVIHGLASLMIGESIMGNSTIQKQLAAPIIGALIYQQIQGIALSLGLAPSDLKFFTGSIVLIVLAIQKGGKDVS